MAQLSDPQLPSRVSVVILNWNGWVDTIECLDSLREVTYPNFDVIVVDNLSTDDSLDRLYSWAREHGVRPLTYSLTSRDLAPEPEEPASSDRWLRLVRSDRNLGFCAGNNVGMELAMRLGSEHFIVLNNDTVCTPDFMGAMVDVAESASDVGLVGGLICYADAPSTIWYAGGTLDGFLESKRVLSVQPLSRLDRETVTETEWISGCLTLIPRRVYGMIGGYDEDYFIWSEEWDLSLRARARGLRLLFAPRALIYHKVGRSLGRLAPLSYYYGTRNRLLLKRKHLGRARRSLFLAGFVASRVPRFGWFAIQRRPDLVHAGTDALVDYLRGRTGKWSKQSD
jgi:GT2 family glycosyltransferase